SSDTRSGLQTYVLTYQVEGTLNAIRGEDGVQDQDELYLNAFADSPNQVDEVTVRITGPADVVDYACYRGPEGSTDSCGTEEPEGNQVTFTGTDYTSRDGLTIMAAFPPGAFTDTDPILEEITGDGPSERQPGPLQRASDFVMENWALLAGVWAALLAAIAGTRIAFGRDETYEGVAPGEVPLEGQPHRVVRLGREPVVAPRFTPPDGLSPGEAEVIEDESVTPEAFTATMIDLAVRGYLTIEPSGTDSRGNTNDWTIAEAVNPPSRDLLKDHEQHLIQALLSGTSSVQLGSFDGRFAPRLREFNQILTKHSDSEGWFRRTGLVGSPPARGFGTFIGWAVFLAYQGVWVAVFAILILNGAGALGLLPALFAAAVAIASLTTVLVLTRRAAHGRTAKGRALYEQLRGFRHYLTTAEAHQLRWEAGADIYSKYLPWALVFGVADRWTSLFEQLAAEGRYTPSTRWYDGGSAGDFRARVRSMGAATSGLNTTGMSALRYTAGSGGGSGSRSSR
ncbi:MAG TPA: DUF2207 domain-containing protein, partial [Actinomycetales bacterium]|nr:DUF2207 domain-containing protein [Actinomycetales bacterium]